ncbi:zinc ion transmembrane transporter [Aureococcus anophagefferens]|nr:zinc ion transmembrane transporter [Aureococcus anophagefferens]
MCNGLQLFTAVESLVATPYAKLEKKVASQQIPAVAAAPAPRKTLASELAGGASFDHSAWDALLKAHVRDDGTVDYGGLERDGDAFRGYLAALAAADVDALGDREQLALHLNAYNALCVAHVLPVHGTLKSILDLSEKDAPIWDKVAGEVGGVAVSLNDIEHERLRLRWDEPELHAAAPRAGGAVARLSRICLWFEDDFDTRGGAAAFVRDTSAARSLAAAAALRYFPTGPSIR